MRWILTVMRHEGYSYDINVFSKETVCNDPKDPWSANTAIPNILFHDKIKFENTFPFKINYRKYGEFLLFPLSGGVNSKRKMINFPFFVLRIIDKIDQFLIALSPDIFAMGISIVLINEK